MGVKKAKRDGQIWRVRRCIWTGALGLGVGVDLAGESPMVKIILVLGLMLPTQVQFLIGEYPSATFGSARLSQA